MSARWLAASALAALMSGFAAAQHHPTSSEAALTAGDRGGVSDEEFRCLAHNVYWEGRSDGERGQRAVAHVTLNRVRHPDFPKTICGVVQQGASDGEPGCQFSWFCNGDSDQPREPEAWEKAQAVARGVLAGQDEDPTSGALYFHLTKVKPPWAGKRQRTAQIGDHVYYK